MKAATTGEPSLQQQLQVVDAAQFPLLIGQLADSGRAPALAALGRRSLGHDFSADFTPAQAVAQAGAELGSEGPAAWPLCSLLGRLTNRSVEPRQITPAAGMGALAEGMPGIKHFFPSFARLLMTCIDVRQEVFEQLTTRRSFKVAVSHVIEEIKEAGGEPAIESKLAREITPIELPSLNISCERAKRNSRWTLEEIMRPRWAWPASVLLEAPMERKARVLEAIFGRYINKPGPRPFNNHRPLKSIVLLHLFCEGYRPADLTRTIGGARGSMLETIAHQIAILRASPTDSDAEKIHDFLTTAYPPARCILGPAQMDRENLQKSMTNLPVWPWARVRTGGDPLVPLAEAPAALLCPPSEVRPPTFVPQGTVLQHEKDEHWELPAVNPEDLNPQLFDMLIQTLFKQTPIYALVTATPENGGATRQQQIAILQEFCRRYLENPRPSIWHRQPRQNVVYLWAYVTAQCNLKYLSEAHNVQPQVFRKALAYLLGQFYWRLSGRGCMGIQAFIKGEADDVDLGSFEPYPGKAPKLPVVIGKGQVAFKRSERSSAKKPSARPAKEKPPRPAIKPKPVKPEPVKQEPVSASVPKNRPAPKPKPPVKARRKRPSRVLPPSPPPPQAIVPRSPRRRAPVRTPASPPPLPLQSEPAPPNYQEQFNTAFNEMTKRLKVSEDERALLILHTRSIPLPQPDKVHGAIRDLRDTGALALLLTAVPRRPASKEVIERFFGLGGYDPQCIGEIRKLEPLMRALQKSNGGLYDSLAEFCHDWLQQENAT